MLINKGLQTMEIHEIKLAFKMAFQALYIDVQESSILDVQDINYFIRTLRITFI